MSTISPEQALIFAMVTMSGVDGRIGDTELKRVGKVVQTLPAFKAFDHDRLTTVAQQCGEILQTPEGLDTVLGLIEGALPQRLRETAYAMAVEVAVADLMVKREEIRFLARLRDTLKLDKLVTSAIERAAVARHASL